jgi:hypothetical protein
VNPGEIRDRLEALRDAGAVLRRRPARETLDALGRVLDGWCAPGSPRRADLAREVAAACGFSPAMVRDALDAALAGYSGAALAALVEREIGDVARLDASPRAMVAGFPTTAVLLAGAIPMPTFVALIAPLALRSPVLAKSAARDPVTARILARSIAEIDAELGQCVDVVAFPRGDDACADALLGADCVVATGSDETVASIAARVRPPRRLVAYGHKLSVAVLSGTVPAQERESALAGLARDVAFWDQLGCLSPVALYTVGGSEACIDAVAESLAAHLATAEARWPRGTIDAAAAGAIVGERDEARLRAAAGARVAVHASADTAYTVVRESEARPRPAPLHRFVRVLPTRDEAAFLADLEPLAPHLAGVAVAGFGEATGPLARALFERGASRVCGMGELQRPPLDWRHNGRGVLTPLARFADWESGLLA